MPCFMIGMKDTDCMYFLSYHNTSNLSTGQWEKYDRNGRRIASPSPPAPANVTSKSFASYNRIMSCFFLFFSRYYAAWVFPFLRWSRRSRPLRRPSSSPSPPPRRSSPPLPSRPETSRTSLRRSKIPFRKFRPGSKQHAARIGKWTIGVWICLSLVLFFILRVLADFQVLFLQGGGWGGWLCPTRALCPGALVLTACVRRWDHRTIVAPSERYMPPRRARAFACKGVM